MVQENPVMEFTEQIKDEGHIETFCGENYEDRKEQCEMLLADEVLGGPQNVEEPPEAAQEAAPPQTQGQAQPEPPEDPIDDLIMGSHEGEVGIETLVADCVGSGFFGFHRPNTESCMRAVAKHERDRRA